MLADIKDILPVGVLIDLNCWNGAQAVEPFEHLEPIDRTPVKVGHDHAYGELPTNFSIIKVNSSKGVAPLCCSPFDF